MHTVMGDIQYASAHRAAMISDFPGTVRSTSYVELGIQSQHQEADIEIITDPSGEWNKASICGVAGKGQSITHEFNQQDLLGPTHPHVLTNGTRVPRGVSPCLEPPKQPHIALIVVSNRRPLRPFPVKEEAGIGTTGGESLYISFWVLSVRSADV